MAHSARAARIAPAGRGIDSFGRVSKRIAPSSLKVSKKTQQTHIHVDVAARFLETQEKPRAKGTVVLPSPSTSTSPKQQRKRRAADAIDNDDDASSYTTAPALAKRARRSIKTKTAITSVAELLARVSKAKAATECSDSDSDRPTSHRLTRIDVAVAAGASSPPRSTSSSPRPASTTPATPCLSDAESDKNTNSTLPTDLVDLVHLQAAFSKTLALYYAHHGMHAPVDLQTLCPSVAQAWGKRQVVLVDVQRCLGVALQGTEHEGLLFLADYGRGKICVELRANAGVSDVNRLGELLNSTFQKTLEARWVSTAAGTTAKALIEELPKAPVVQCASLTRMSARRAKGQQSLEELMRGIALKKQAQEAQTALLKSHKDGGSMDVDAVSTEERNEQKQPMNLLDRIRYRQQLQKAQEKACAAPTTEELERRAALQRAGDIAEVLMMLCTADSSRGANRVSFGMTSVLGTIQDSLTQPLAREEAAVCVRLLAQEVAPQWLQLVSMGGREIVIMIVAAMPSKAAVQNRVKTLSQ